jgi:hypothetical protein
VVKWHQDKVRKTLKEPVEMEMKEGGGAFDYSIPKEQAAFEEADSLCNMMGSRD